MTCGGSVQFNQRTPQPSHNLPPSPFKRTSTGSHPNSEVYRAGPPEQEGGVEPYFFVCFFFISLYQSKINLFLSRFKTSFTKSILKNHTKKIRGSPVDLIYLSGEESS